MCGRVRLTNDYTELKIAFRLPAGPALNFPVRWNGAPTQQFPIITRDTETGSRRMDLAKWGLIPGWAKDAKIGYSTFNARAEELAGKPTFRAAWKAGRRAVVPLSGFYEWKKLGPKDKQPYLITLKDGAPMAIAGLWETKKLDGGDVFRSFTIITTSANRFMSELHDRMPVLLDMKNVPAWLGEDDTSLDDAGKLMKSAPEKSLVKVPVDKRMGNVKNWGEEFCQPVQLIA